MKIKKTYIINPEDEEHGFLLWLNLIYAQFGNLFYANLIAVVSMLPAAYLAYVFVTTHDLVYQLLFILLMGVAGPGLTVLAGTACRVSLRRPVWLKEDLKAVLTQDLKQSILLGMLTGVVWSVIFDAAYLLYAAEGAFSLPLLLIVAVYGYLAAGFTFFSFQQLAMLEVSFGRVIVNGFLLIFAGKGRSFLAVMNLILVLGICAYFYGIGVILVIAGIPVLALMTSNQIFTPVFSSLFLERKEEA